MEQRVRSGDGTDTVQALQRKLQALEDESDMLETIIENSTDAIQISDSRQVTLRVNRAYEVLTGIKREELVGVPVEDLVRQNLISESCSSIVAKTKRPHTIVQFFPRTGRSAHVSCNPVFDSHGKIRFYICNDRDLNEIRNLQEELNKAQSLNERYLSELATLKAQLPQFADIIVEDKAMLKVMAMANRVAKVDSTVLILGETGVGKDETALFIHQNSSRAQQKFITINCGAITESLFESELFGREAYAFTGAGSKLKIGLLEVANHGTVFLDEVGELSLNMQVKLLHVLQHHTLTRVGGTQPVSIDVRIIAATNCDLEKMVREKQFREDLFYRLSVMNIRIPPLRERKNDIIPLAQHFLQYYNVKYDFQKRLSADACFALLNYYWEGNVRQLKNIIEQAVIMSEGNEIHADTLPLRRSETLEQDRETAESRGMTELLEQVELRYLNLYYERCGNIRDAARSLKMSPTTFLRHRTQLSEKYKDNKD